MRGSLSTEPWRRLGAPSRRGGGGLHLDLYTQLDDALRRQSEKGCGAHGVAGHHDKQLLAPDSHAVPAGDDDGFAAEEVCDVMRIQWQAEMSCLCESRGHVRIVHEPVLHTHV